MAERDRCTDLGEHARHYADMAPHTATVTRLAAGARTAVELGTRGGVSTWALLDGLPADGRLLSVDVDPGVADLVPARVREDRRWTLMTADSLEVALPPVDLAFIDTDHTYDRTLGELRAVAAAGARVIALHDWALDPVRDAIHMFLVGDPHWSLAVEPSQWGLAILERRP